MTFKTYPIEHLVAASLQYQKQESGKVPPMEKIAYNTLLTLTFSEEALKEAREAIDTMLNEYTISVLMGSNISGFNKTLMEELQKPESSRTNILLYAGSVFFHSQAAKKRKEQLEEYTYSEWLRGREGDKVETRVKVLGSNFIITIQMTAYQCVTDDGNLVSFLTKNTEQMEKLNTAIETKERVLLRGKIKDFNTVWKTNVKCTQLNYVKVFDL